MNDPWPPPDAPRLDQEFQKARDNDGKETPKEEQGRLTDSPRPILVPPGVSQSSVPPVPPSPPMTDEEQRAERMARMQQKLQAKDDFNRATQCDQGRGL